MAGPWEKYASLKETSGPWAKYSGQVPSPKLEEPGIVESGLRGVEQGLTFGYGDEANAALETLLNQATGANKDLSILDQYRKSRGESREKFKAAEEANPITSILGNIAGSIIPAIASGGGSLAEEGLMGAAKMGAKYGAVSGLGGSEADLTKGELGKAATDTALGGAIGSAVTPMAGKLASTVLPTVGRGLGHLFDIGPIATGVDALKQGLKGRVLFTKGGEKAIGEEVASATGALGTDVQEALTKASQDKAGILASEGPPVNINKWAADADTMIGNLNKTRGQDKAVQDDIERVQDIINRHIYGVMEEEDPGRAIPGKGATPSSSGAETMLRQLGSLGSASESSGLKTNEGKELVNRLVSPITRESNPINTDMGIPSGYTSLGELVEQSRPQLAEKNALISGLTQAKRALPTVRDTMNLEKPSASGIIASSDYDSLISKLPKELQDKYSDKLRDLSKAKQMSETIANTGGLAKGFVEKITNKLTYGGANIAGNILYEMTPDAIKKMAGVVSQGGTPAHQALSRILSQAGDKDQIGRNALLFSLQQNPAYRKILNDMQGTPSK